MATSKKTKAGGILAAVAAGLGLFFLFGKKASAASGGGGTVDPGTGDEPIEDPVPGGGGGGVNAPKYPPKGWSAEQVAAAEAGAVNSVMAGACNAETGLCTLTIAEMTSAAWKIVYGGVKIPGASSQGSGWGNWIDAWNRLTDLIEDLLPYGKTVFSGGQPINAPNWPPGGLTAAQAKLMEAGEATNAVAQNCNPATKKCSKTIEQMSSQAWKAVYGGAIIPPESKQGSGWKPWIDAWYRITNHVMNAAKSYS